MTFQTYRDEDLKPLREKDDSEYIPDDEEVEEYARYIGILLPEEDYMWELAKEGVKASLPDGWQACQTPDGELVYRNTRTRVIQEQHPMDEIYRQRVIKYREQYERQGKQDSESENESLNTIPQQKSQQKSLHDDSQLDEMMMPSKQFFQPSSTLKEEYQELNQAILSSPKSNSIASARENSKFLANLGSFDQTGRLEPGLGRDSKMDQQKQKEKLKAELEMLLAQQKLAQQLLSQLQKDNERRTKKLKSKLNPHGKTPKVQQQS